MAELAPQEEPQTLHPHLRTMGDVAIKASLGVLGGDGAAALIDTFLGRPSTAAEFVGFGVAAALGTVIGGRHQHLLRKV